MGEIKLNRVTFTRPAGNDTAIIWDQLDRGDYPYIASLIQRDFSNIEQVMFVETKSQTGLVHGQMAGGEFCANATRSLAYLLKKDENGLIEMSVSGSSLPIKTNVQVNGASLKIPLKGLGTSFIKKFTNDQYAVDMDGIVHLICFEGDILFNNINSIKNIVEKKNYIKELISTEAYQNYPACGVILARKKDSLEIEIDPFVYVRKTGTLYNETSCASGSAAVAIICAFQQGCSIQNLKILQPSGLYMRADVVCNNNFFEGVRVGGDISILYDGEISLSTFAGGIQNAI